MELLRGKKLLITGVLTKSSIAFEVARLAQHEGAEIVLTGHGNLRLVERLAARLEPVPPVIPLDVTCAEDLASLAQGVAGHVDSLDGVLHSVAFAPEGALGGRFLTTPWNDAATALHVSAYSLKALTCACLPLMPHGGSVVGLQFDASRVWSGYDWMGVAKAGLEACSRYLAAYLGGSGIRVNLVASGPVKTLAARGIGGGLDGTSFYDSWDAAAPLGWDGGTSTPVAKACLALLSDWFPATTGEVIHVDGGFHVVGAGWSEPTQTTVGA